MPKIIFHVACGFDHELGKCPFNATGNSSNAYPKPKTTVKTVHQPPRYTSPSPAYSYKPKPANTEKLSNAQELSNHIHGKREIQSAIERLTAKVSAINIDEAKYTDKILKISAVISAPVALLVGVFLYDAGMRFNFGGGIFLYIVILVILNSMLTRRMQFSETRTPLEKQLNEKRLALAKVKRRVQELQELERERVLNIKRKELNFWSTFTGHQFEHEVARVYRKHGYSAIVTKGSGDGGIDIVMEKEGKKIIVQCKHHRKGVGPETARALYGVLKSMRASEAILVSSNGFTKGVKTFAEGKRMQLVTLEDILTLDRVTG